MKNILKFLVTSCFMSIQAHSIATQTENELVIAGKVDAQMHFQIGRYLEQGGKTIRITSEGGDVKVGLRIGRLIRDKKATVIVKDYCMSSCANYIFLAADKKIVLPASLLGFHGGVSFTKKATIDESETQTPNQMPVKLSQMSAEESAFFASVGFDSGLLNESFERTKNERDYISITVHGKETIEKSFPVREKEAAKNFLKSQMKRHGFRSWEIAMVNEGASKGMYFPSRRTLEKFGVQNIVSFSYPDTQDELELLVKRLSIEAKAIGDFSN